MNNVFSCTSFMIALSISRKKYIKVGVKRGAFYGDEFTYVLPSIFVLGCQKKKKEAWRLYVRGKKGNVD